MFAADTPEREGCEKACRLTSRHATVSGRLSSTRMLSPLPIPSTTYDDTVAAILRGKLPKVHSCMGAVHDEVVCEFDGGVFDSPDYAALEMSIMASLMNKKESE